jgi:hypothetical protein
MLIFGDPTVNPGIGTVSKWLDSKSNGEQEMMALLKSQPHRRYIKTHTPLDGITYDPRRTYLAVTDTCWMWCFLCGTTRKTSKETLWIA